MPKPIVCLSDVLCQFLESAEEQSQGAYYRPGWQPSVAQLVRVCSNLGARGLGSSNLALSARRSPGIRPRSTYLGAKTGTYFVLITRPSPDATLEQTRYWRSTLVDADAQTVIDILAIRWNIEVFFEDCKDLLGSDRY